jgi:hypothetical protein
MRRKSVRYVPEHLSGMSWDFTRRRVGNDTHSGSLWLPSTRSRYSFAGGYAKSKSMGKGMSKGMRRIGSPTRQGAIREVASYQ